MKNEADKTGDKDEEEDKSVFFFVFLFGFAMISHTWHLLARSIKTSKSASLPYQ